MGVPFQKRRDGPTRDIALATFSGIRRPPPAEGVDCTKRNAARDKSGRSPGAEVYWRAANGRDGPIVDMGNLFRQEKSDYCYDDYSRHNCISNAVSHA